MNFWDFSKTRFFWIALLFLALPFPLRAATFDVNDTADSVDMNLGDGNCLDANGRCTLRAAIQETNALAGLDVIQIPAGLYTLTIAGAGEGQSATGDLNVLDDLQITGAGMDPDCGPGSTCIDGGGSALNDRLITVSSSSARLVLSHLTVKNAVKLGLYVLQGGDIALDHVAVVDHKAVGLMYQSDGILVVQNSIFKGNGSFAIDQAALALQPVSTASVAIIENTSIYGNQGIGVYQQADSTTIINNSTIYGNTVAFSGGGIYCSLGSMHLRNVTVTANTAQNITGGVHVNNCSLDMQNTIIAGNTDSFDFSPDCFGNFQSLQSGGYNIIGNSKNCAFTGMNGVGGDQIGSAASPLLLDQIFVLDAQNLPVLGNNGGETSTVALAAGGIAVDTGNSTGCTGLDDQGVVIPLNQDQRGQDRIGSCDIGAFEFDVCGNGVTGLLEACDDANTITEACACGQTSCTVCASDCTLQSGITTLCEDGEDTDNGDTEANATPISAGGVSDPSAPNTDPSVTGPDDSPTDTPNEEEGPSAGGSEHSAGGCSLTR